MPALVLPKRSMFIGIFSAGTPSCSRTYSLMRWLAWWARNQSIWSIDDLRLLAERARALGQLRHRELEELLAVHPRDVRLLVEHVALPVRPRPEAAARDVEELGGAAVGVELEPARPGVAIGRAEDERARAVAEEDGERAVLVRALALPRA